MTTYHLPVTIDLWISEENVEVFVGDDPNASVEFPLERLIEQEVLAHAIPATAQSIDEADAVSPPESLEKLEHALVNSLALVRTALNKNKD